MGHSRDYYTIHCFGWTGRACEISTFSQASKFSKFPKRSTIFSDLGERSQAAVDFFPTPPLAKISKHRRRYSQSRSSQVTASLSTYLRSSDPRRGRWHFFCVTALD